LTKQRSRKADDRPNLTAGGDIVGGDKIIAGGDYVGRDKIVTTIGTFVERALTAAEAAEQAKSIEAQYLAQGVSAFAQRLQARASDTADADRGGPYKGLLEYRLSDAEIFFGRARAIDDLLEHLQRGPLTVLHAESGAGKTSLLQAGISPRLIAAGHLPVYLRPYNVLPSLALKRAFLPNLNDAPNLAQASLRDFLLRVGDVLGPQANHGVRSRDFSRENQTTLYIFLDQFEEFFTQLEEPAQPDFVRELAECLDDESLNVRWVLALRSEFFGNLANFRPRIRNPFENDYRLNRLTRAEAREAVAEPAARRGITFADGLIDTLLDELGKDEVAPPQVQLVCSTLYEALPSGETVITRELYHFQGDAAGILRGHLGRVLKRDLPAEQRSMAQRLLEALITSDIRRVIRTQAELAAELTPMGVRLEALEAILGQLVDSRLLRVEEVDGGLAYELAHDYLLDEIKLDPAVQARKATQELLEQEVRAYQRYGTLLSDDKLAIIEARRGELVLSDDAKALLQKSERALKRRRGLLLSGAGVVLILIVLAVLSVITTVGAIQTQNVVLTREAKANEFLLRTFEKSGIVPVGTIPVALAYDGTRLWVANGGDNTVQAIDPATGDVDAPVTVGNRPAALVFDGVRLWVANLDDGTVQAIDPVTGDVGMSIAVGLRPDALTFDGTQLWVVNSGDNTVQAIDPATGDVSAPIVFVGIPSALAFDTLRARLWVAIFGDDTVQAIDPTTGEVSAPIKVGRGPSALAFDGTRLWVANRDDDTVQAIDPVMGEVSAPIVVSSFPVALAFDGTRLWVSGGDGTVQAIDPVTGDVSAPIAVGRNPSALAFDRRRLWIANGDDDTVQAIDAALGDVGTPIAVGSFPAALAFDGTRLWVANFNDNSVQAIDPATAAVSMSIVVGRYPVALVFDTLRARLWVANSFDDTVQAIDPATGEVGAPIAVGNGPSALAFDGTRLWVANGGDNTVQAIDPATGGVGSPIAVGDTPVALAFDGRRLWVVNSFDDTVQAIDPATGNVSVPIKVGDVPEALVFDGTRLWVVNTGADTLQAIDPTTGDVGAPIKVGDAPTALAFDGTQLWVANFGDDTVQAIDPATGNVGASIPVGRRPFALAFDGRRLWVANQIGNTVQYIMVHKRINE